MVLTSSLGISISSLNLTFLKMNIFVPILCLISLTLAEPPVGDGYPTAGSHNHHHNDGYDNHHPTSENRAVSEAYGPPAFASRNTISNEFPSNTRSFQSSGQNHMSSKARVSSNRSNSTTSRSSQGSSTANMQGYDSPKDRSESFEASPATNTNNQGYETPNARSDISQEYGPPASRSLSQEYGSPDVSARTLSTEYGMPDVRSNPSQEYGVPIVAARSNQRSQLPKSNLRSAQSGKSLSQGVSSSFTRSQMDKNDRSQSRGYSASSRRSNDVTQGYEASKSFAKAAFGSKIPPQKYASPESESSTFDAPSSRSLSTSHRTSSARNSVSDSQGYNSGRGAQSLNTPHHQLEINDGSAMVRSQDLEPSSRTNGKNMDLSSSNPLASSRSSPASTYLPAGPASRNAMPSQQYGVPEQENKGYDSAKARALEELLNQEPANYDFSYQIEDQESGSDFGHSETRHGNSARGSYFVVLPDGTKQTVEYEADERGFKPRISMEPAPRGYDDNAQDIADRSAEGPY